MSRRRLLSTAVLGLSLCLGQTTNLDAGGAEEASFRRVVTYHLDKYPSMEMQDLYKLAFQATMGNEHAVPDRQAAQRWLDRELATLGAGSGEPFSVPLSPDGELVRVNLRAFVEQGGDTAKLIDAFVETANRFGPSEERLTRYWDVLEAMAETGVIPYESGQMREWFADMRAQGFPAVRHSSTYRDRYQPAYRVVYLKLLSLERPGITGQ